MVGGWWVVEVWNDDFSTVAQGPIVYLWEWSNGIEKEKVQERKKEKCIDEKKSDEGRKKKETRKLKSGKDSVKKVKRERWKNGANMNGENLKS